MSADSSKINSLLPVWFIEPTAADKRRQIALARKRPAEPFFNMDEVKRTLQDIRTDALNNFLKFEKKLKSSLKKRYNVNVTSAPTGLDVVDYINDTLGDINTLAINRSSTIREIQTALPEDMDLQFFDSYNAALESSLDMEISKLESGGRGIAGYWDLPYSEPVQIWNSFNLDPAIKGYYRTESPSIPGKYAALMGVNCLTSDGNMFMLQHLQNITNVLANAETAIFVVGLEKLVRHYEQGLFQTRCSALFGYETILLELFDRTEEGPEKTKAAKKRPAQPKLKAKKKGSKTGRADQSFIEFSLPAEVHVIILDNGRKGILDTKFKDILKCIGCGACGRLCPRTRWQGSESRLNARDLIMSAFTFGLEYAKDNGLFDCTLCRNCQFNCPVDIPLQDYLNDLRKACEREKLLPPVYDRLYENILNYNTPYGKK
ncbi:MAG: lactate utilization protein [Thermoplasmata archaeon]|nr:MAG: lactate utilization protein [Thermoplasmata archaeon]